MTVSSTTNKVSMVGNGITTTLSITYPYLNKTNIAVYSKDGENPQEQMAYGTDFSIVDITDLNNRIVGGTITFTTAPAVGVKVVAIREVPYTQETDYRENDIFPAETHELALDKLTMAVQELEEQATRSVKADIISDIDPQELVQQMERIYGSIDNIYINANNIADINTNADNITDINDVASIKEDISKVANVDTKVSAVADSLENINDVADNLTDIVINATAIEDIKKTANISMEIANVNDISDNVVAVDGIKDEVVIVAENIADVKDKANKDLSNVTVPEKLVPTPTTDNTALTYKNGAIAWGKASAENDGITIHENAQDKLEVLGVIDAVDSKAMRFVECTKEQYEQLKSAGELTPNTFYWKNDEVSTNVKSFRNVGDKFETLRTDTYLNGAVECDGSEYDIRDYTGTNSIGVLLANSKLPYLSYADYATAVSTSGYCEQFAWDGGNDFKVPTIKRVLVNDNSLLGLTTDATYSGIIADLSNNHAVYIRTMIQLATQTTDEAIATMTHLQSLPHIIDSQPTATGGYNVYSNGYYEEWGKVIHTDGTGQRDVLFSKTMKDLNYNLQVGIESVQATSTSLADSEYNYCLTTGFKTYVDSNIPVKRWKVCGFLAEGEY